MGVARTSRNSSRIATMRLSAYLSSEPASNGSLMSDQLLSSSEDAFLYEDEEDDTYTDLQDGELFSPSQPMEVVPTVRKGGASNPKRKRIKNRESST